MGGATTVNKVRKVVRMMLRTAVQGQAVEHNAALPLERVQARSPRRGIWHDEQTAAFLEALRMGWGPGRGEPAKHHQPRRS